MSADLRNLSGAGPDQTAPANGLPRRQWFQQAAKQALAAGGASALLPSFLLPAQAAPASAADLAPAFKSQALMQALVGVNDSGGHLQASAMLRGRWPTELQGRFYRNGPALFERGGERYHHWFDGDGMVQQFKISKGRVSHIGRLVQTQKLGAEQAAGRFLYSAFGTQVDGGPPAQGPDTFNTANTSVLEHGGRLMALWEGGSAYALKTDDLSSLGPVTWRPDLQQLPFSAHPKLDSAGHLWNFGSMGKALMLWHIDPSGQLAGWQLGESPFPGGMVHDMAVTERFVILPLPPVKLGFGEAFGDKGGSKGPRPFVMEAGQPMRWLVMDKNDIRKRWVFELPPQMVFHVGNAHESGPHTLEVSYVSAPDLWFLNGAAVAMMKAQPYPQANETGRTNTCLARLHLDSGRAEVTRLPGLAEFPRMDPRRVGRRNRWLATTTSWNLHPERRPWPLMHGVQLQDLKTGLSRRFDYGAHMVVEEHIWVPKPHQQGELDSWLLGTTFDARRQATVLNLLDAAHIEDGPVAQAVLPYALPLGFHGNFSAA